MTKAATEYYRPGQGRCKSCLKIIAAETRASKGIPIRKRRTFDDGGQVCTSCNTYKPYEEYHKGQYRCKICALHWHEECRRSEGILPNRYSVECEEVVACDSCKVDNPIKDILLRKRELNGINICRSCNQRTIERNGGFNRRHRQRGVDDGTVTSDIINELYSREICTYCKTFVDRPNRTVDHIVALANGGLHTVSNLTMSCRPCNSSKGKRPLEEFLKELHDAQCKDYRI